MLLAILIFSVLNFLGIVYVLMVLNSAFKFTNTRIDFFASQNSVIVKRAEEVIAAFKKMTKTINDA